jgi:SAM-dependent methyltransferase
MYDEGDDPWQFADSFYEERRRTLVLAVLGCRRYARALEIGCADGRLTQALVGRCDEVLALDTSHRAVTAARVRAPAARVVQGMAPADLPDGPFDLVLVSEVGYFLSPLELLATLRRCHEVLAPGGEIVLCHWQHPTRDVPLDGVLVHEQAATVLPARHRATYVDDDLRIDVWGDATSLARQEGRA